MKEFLFNYRFRGAEWGIAIFAEDAAEARKKIKAVALARYEGELMMRVPAVVPGAGAFARFLCKWKNFRSQ